MNEDTPVWDAPSPAGVTWTIDEEQPTGTVITTIAASDADSPVTGHGQVTYKIVSVVAGELFRKWQ